MKKTIKALFVLLTFGQALIAKPTPIDSMKSQLRQMQSQQIRTNDSLRRELQYYKVKEDYYVNAVSIQTTHYEALFGSILAFLGLAATVAGYFSYNKFKNDIANQEVEFNDKLDKYRQENDSNFSSTEIERKRIDFDIYRNLAKIPNIIEAYESKSSDELMRYLIELELFLGSIMLSKNAYLLSNKDNKNLVALDISTNINAANKRLNSIKEKMGTEANKDPYLKILKDRYADSEKHFNDLIDLKATEFSSNIALLKENLKIIAYDEVGKAGQVKPNAEEEIEAVKKKRT